MQLKQFLFLSDLLLQIREEEGGGGGVNLNLEKIVTIIILRSQVPNFHISMPAALPHGADHENE